MRVPGWGLRHDPRRASFGCEAAHALLATVTSALVCALCLHVLMSCAFDLSNPRCRSQSALEHAYLVVVKNNVKIGLATGTSLLEDVPTGVALVYTEDQVPPSLPPSLPHTQRLSPRPMPMCCCSDLPVRRCTSALWC